MAKLYATEAAQRVVDRACSCMAGAGVTKGSKVEELYREVRALRIYEGASEVQRRRHRARSCWSRGIEGPAAAGLAAARGIQQRHARRRARSSPWRA